LKKNIFILIITLSLVGCGGGGGETTSSSEYKNNVIAYNPNTNTTNIVEQPTEEAIDIPVEETTAEDIDIPVEETTEEAIDIPIEETTEEAIDIPIEETTEEAIDIPVEETTEEEEVVIVIPPESEIESPVPEILCQSGSSTVLGKVLDSNTQKPISNAMVSVNGCYAYTNKEGYFELLNVEANLEAFIYTSSDNYLENIKKMKIDRYLEGTNIKSNNFITISMDLYSSIDSHINLNENKISKFYYSQNINPRTFPGSFEGINYNGSKVLFENKALLFFSLKDNEFSEEAKLIFTVSSDKDSLPLWHFNKENNIWEEIGTAEKNENGEFISYVNQDGFWALNEEVSTGTFIGRIIYKNEEPAKDIRVYMFGKNWQYSFLSTTDNGEFQIPVKANSDFSIYAYNYKDDYKAEYVGDKFQVIAEGEVFDERS